MTKYIRPASTGSTAPDYLGESKDCVVRAMANVTGMSYEEAHSIAKANGREANSGMSIGDWLPMYNEQGIKLMGIFGTTTSAYAISKLDKSVPHYKGMTLRNALRTFSKGTYIFCINGHVMTVIDGKIQDNGYNKLGAYVVAILQKSN